MTTIFELGQPYTRPEIRRIVGDPSSQGGAWDTGYREWRGEFFVFAGVGATGRTGHDYDNHWDGENLVWQARGQTNLRQPQIQALLSGGQPVHLFTRAGDRLPWTYRGLATPLSAADTSPVTVVWAFDAEPNAALPFVAIPPLAEIDGDVDPRTESEAVRAARLGQSKFRRDLMERWDRRCAVTGLPLPELLRASHIKPWRHSSARERLDPDNGLLLAVHVDGLFDRGLISFRDDGALMRSPMLPGELMVRLGLDQAQPISKLSERTRHYLDLHRKVYLKGPPT